MTQNGTRGGFPGLHSDDDEKRVHYRQIKLRSRQIEENVRDHMPLPLGPTWHVPPGSASERGGHAQNCLVIRVCRTMQELKKACLTQPVKTHLSGLYHFSSCRPIYTPICEGRQTITRGARCLHPPPHPPLTATSSSPCPAPPTLLRPGVIDLPTSRLLVFFFFLIILHSRFPSTILALSLCSFEFSRVPLLWPRPAKTVVGYIARRVSWMIIGGYSYYC